MEALQRRTWAEVSLGAIEHNYRAIRGKIPAFCRFLAVVKTDAYGHGAEKIAPFVEKLGADYLAATSLDDAAAMRAGGVKTPILIFGRTDPEYAPELMRLDITQEADNLRDAESLSEAALKAGGRIRVHIKADSGMSRLGFSCEDEASVEDICSLMALPGIDVEGIFTHFAVSDVKDDEYTRLQFGRFTELARRVENITGRKIRIKHCANTGAVINYPEMSLDMVRPGLALYGLYPDRFTGGLVLQPAMQLRTRVAAVREIRPGDSVSYGRMYTASAPRRIAVLPIGYGDGLHRALSNKMDVLINGKRAPQTGRICMDMCMIDVTGIPCKVGDVATVFGRDGESFLPIEEQAQKAGTISYELTCAVAARVPRIYTA